MLNNFLYISRTFSECDYIRLVAFLFTTQQVVCQLAAKEMIFTVSEKKETEMLTHYSLKFPNKPSGFSF